MKIKRIRQLFKLTINSFFADTVLAGTPMHGNIGDQAIAIGELSFFKEKLPEKRVIELDGELIRKYPSWYIKLLITKKTIAIHGGGFLGDLYPREEDMVRKIITLFPNNKIIIFPQTLWYEKHNDYEKIGIDVYSSHKNLTICLREKRSYDIAQMLFKNNTILLVPDMVLYMSPIVNDKSQKDVCFCFRKDKEKCVSDEQISLLEAIFKKRGFAIHFTDTVVPYYIDSDQRENIVNDKIQEFSKYDYVVTDRLHGMVLAYLAGSNVLAFDNSNGKVGLIYEWIKNAGRVTLVSSMDDVIARLEAPNNSGDAVVLDQLYQNLINLF